ncbi:hypothetical protein KEM54_000208 [Ascosphaera aggregata]|nr:hypothetical protein KEM54_000208 [Ascosphaera aggregata]
MGSLTSYLAVYVLGGFTFVPLIFIIGVAIAYFTLPQVDIEQYVKQHQQHRHDESSTASRNLQDDATLKPEPNELKEKFIRTHESDVAAGYFAVLREYSASGANGKPSERANTPANETTATEGTSVYQSVYRSLFDRKTSPTIEPAKDNGKQTKKSNNIFYVVLRHGHILLYDDAEQIEVRYVISLAHHNVSISVGGESIPEGELWSKRTAVCLSRTSEADKDSTLPYYFFSENASEKEDFYFAIVANLERVAGSFTNPPIPQKYDAKHIVTLIKKLHSSEEQLQTRWLNALIGRWFLGVYRTQESKMLIRKKIEKKLSRVKTPNFITRLALDFIDLGDAAPLITNPRLKDLTIDGQCCVQFDTNYAGNFRAGLAATARIELGPRIKARKVDMVLSVALKRFSGHCLLMIKPPPSNRMWICFETMPDIDMTIEPIVSSRQITYGLVLRAIENKIREAVAETLVLPFWDDIPFLDTEGKFFRGGIWAKAPEPRNDEDNITLQHAATAPEIGETNEPSLNELLTSLQERSSDESHRAETMSVPEESQIPQSRSEASSISSSGKMGATLLPLAAEEEPDGQPQKRPKSKSMSKSSSLSLRSLLSNAKTSDTEEQDALRDQDPAPLTLQIKANSASSINSATVEEQRSLKDSQETIEPLSTRPHSQANDDSDIRPATSSAATIPQVEAHRGMGALSTVSTESRATTKSRNQHQVMDSLNSAAAAAKKWSLNVLNRKNDDSSDDDQPRRFSLSRRSSLRTTETRNRPIPPPRHVPPREIPPVPPRKPQANAKNAAPVKRKPLPPPFVPAPPAAQPERPPSVAQDGSNPS